MTSIVAMHGVVAHRRNDLLCHANFADESQFEHHLVSRPTKYVSVTDVLAHGGEALTIDDATRGGGRAAMLARQYGHEVTLFVNRHFVVQKRRYFFHRLNHIIDGITEPIVNVDGETVEARTPAQRKLLKKRLKRRYCALPNITERDAMLDHYGPGFQADYTRFPAHLETLTESELSALKAAGVALENHGDTHVHYNSISEAERAKDLDVSLTWLREFGAAEQNLFAVPFGDPLPTQAVTHNQCTVWLLEYDGYPKGRIGSHRWRNVIVWNRAPLVL